MPITPYRALSWQPNDVLTENKMNRMTSNDHYIFEHMPHVLYRAHGVRRNEGVKIAAGLCMIAASKKSYGSNRVTFGNFFSMRCNPVVTHGTVSNEMNRIHVSIRGIGQLHPDHRGFQVRVSTDAANKKNNRIKRRFYVSWIAMGY